MMRSGVGADGSCARGVVWDERGVILDLGMGGWEQEYELLHIMYRCFLSVSGQGFKSLRVRRAGSFAIWGWLRAGWGWATFGQAEACTPTGAWGALATNEQPEGWAPTGCS